MLAIRRVNAGRRTCRDHQPGRWRSPNTFLRTPFRNSKLEVVPATMRMVPVHATIAKRRQESATVRFCAHARLLTCRDQRRVVRVGDG